MHVSTLHGCPDFFFPGKRIAVFVDGCFWHGCPTCGHTPRSNRPYWNEKLDRNTSRDVPLCPVECSSARNSLFMQDFDRSRSWHSQMRRTDIPINRRVFATWARDQMPQLRQ